MSEGVHLAGRRRQWEGPQDIFTRERSQENVRDESRGAARENYAFKHQDNLRARQFLQPALHVQARFCDQVCCP